MIMTRKAYTPQDLGTEDAVTFCRENPRKAWQDALDSKLEPDEDLINALGHIEAAELLGCEVDTEEFNVALDAYNAAWRARVAAELAK